MHFLTSKDFAPKLFQAKSLLSKIIYATKIYCLLDSQKLGFIKVIQKQSFRLKISPYFAVIPRGKRKTEEDTLEESAFMLEKTLVHHSKNFILTLRKLFSSFVFTQNFKILQFLTILQLKPLETKQNHISTYFSTSK